MKRKTKNNSESLLILKDKDINNETIPIEKVHIYNNNRHLQKSNSAGNIRLFFEPYYSELKNSTNNSLFNTKQLKKTILQIEYVNFPKVDDNLLEETRPERYLQKKNVFANNDNNIRGYNNYNINDYNNTYGRNDYYRYNNVNINRLPKINNNIHYNYNEYNNNYNTNNNNINNNINYNSNNSNYNSSKNLNRVNTFESNSDRDNIHKEKIKIPNIPKSNNKGNSTKNLDISHHSKNNSSIILNFENSEDTEQLKFLEKYKQTLSRVDEDLKKLGVTVYNK